MINFGTIGENYSEGTKIYFINLNKFLKKSKKKSNILVNNFIILIHVFALKRCKLKKKNPKIKILVLRL